LWPAWSPDGSFLAFEKLYCSGVFLINVRTGHRRSLGISGTHPAWVDNCTLVIEDVGAGLVDEIR
jgi:hypothetical protein